ncbi:DUF2505 domain-containing protein [Algiphilus sp. W345]|uniref:DUF2505 domain-containing protein n=1 Tax=Banduia mediterranea TaxID=3075609 RepID=A0ABU2WIK7_9GAMM|nr:DUF2505 domain-containing protein [Algiphilus sp. W345]MDT0497692.1 DUF2505 domain-containing protein [Algiphilus sp. W345]
MLNFDETLQLGGNQERFFRMLQDKSFFERKYKDMRLQTAEVLEHEGVGEVIKVTVRYSAPLGEALPPIAQKFVGDEIVITQHEQWDFSTGKASIRQEVRNAPAKIGSDIEFGEAADGVQVEMHWHVNVSVPMIGAKLEKMIGDTLRMMMKAEFRSSRKLLAEY